jgi:hypothetical protein
VETFARLAYEAGLRMLDKQEHYDARNNVGEIYRRLAYDLDRIWDGNDEIVLRLLAAFRWSAAALVVEIILLLAALRGTL